MINLLINAQELSIVTQKVVSGTHQYLTVNAVFKGTDWEDMRKWVHFSMGPFNYVIPMTDDKIESDMCLDLTEGTWEVYVHGNLLSDDEVTERITTDVKLLFVDAPHDGHPFPPLTPDFEEVLANQIMEAKSIAQSVRDDADAGELDGATYLPTVNEEGEISWTNDKGKENPEPCNIKGPKGDIGDSGVYIGTTAPTDPKPNVWINPEGYGGKVISNVSYSGTHEPGTNDTLKLYFSDGTDLTISIYNGVDGSGTGDMRKNIYDASNKAQDIFDYADAIKDKTINSGLLKGSNGSIVPATAGTDYQIPLIAGTDYQTPLSFDNSPTANSNNPVKSSGIKTALDLKANAGDLATVARTGNYNDLSNKPTIPPAVTVDSALSLTSTNPVRNSAVTSALANKQDVLTIDSAMSNNSTNPVQNKTIKQYVDSQLLFVTENYSYVPSTNPVPAGGGGEGNLISNIGKYGYVPVFATVVKNTSNLNICAEGINNFNGNYTLIGYYHNGTSSSQNVASSDVTIRVWYASATA